jgi:hypothetical protein
MDEDLQRLTREAATHPNDEGLARRLDHALRRAGRDDARRARFRFKFQCPLRYEDLAPSEHPLVRSCERCHRQVRFVANADELAEQVAQGHCVAFERRALDGVIALVANDPRQHSAIAPGTPCLVPTDLEFVRLDAITPPLEAVSVFPGALARDHRAFPVARTRSTLRLAFAVTPTSKVLDDLRFMLGLTIEPVLAEPADVDRAIEETFDSDDPTEFLLGDVIEVDDDS